MARRYFTNPLPPTGRTTLGKHLGHYLGRIVRARPGDGAILFDGDGAEAHATIVAVGARELLVDVGNRVTTPLGRLPRMQLQVACALPKSPRADWLFEHGTEAGIAIFRPILTERSRPTPQRAEHWRRILIEACAQADRSMLPTIAAAVTLDQLLAQPLPDERYVATDAPTELGAATAAEALIVVGPEGGLAGHEVEALIAAGFAPRSLGPLTLRTETAVLAAATRLLQREPPPHR